VLWIWVTGFSSAKALLVEVAASKSQTQSVWQCTANTWSTAIPWAFRYDVEGKGREDAYWRPQVGVPMSEGQTAHTTKIAIMQLFVPSAWVNFYAVTSRVYPRTFILVSLVAQTGLLIVTPFVWPDSAAHKRNKVTLAVEASVIGLYFSVVYCVVLYSAILRCIVQCIVVCCSALPCT
jgi:hypothetical protein